MPRFKYLLYCQLAYTNSIRLDYRKTDQTYSNFPRPPYLPGTMYLSYPPLVGPGCHCIFKIFHRCVVNIYRYGFKSPARNGDLKSMSFVHMVTSILVDDSFFCSSFFCFNNINTSVRSFTFSLSKTVSYIYNLF